MKSYTMFIWLAVTALVAGCNTREIGTGNATAPAASEAGWQTDFGLAGRTLEPTGRNQFFILEPGYQLAFAGEDEELKITVLDETVKVGEINTRVVEEREWKNGELAEVSRNFFAICKDTGDVFYFGEEVDEYRNGKIAGHGGAWRADQPGMKPGLMMPGSPRIGMKHYLEIAPGVAMDRAEIVSLTTTLKTPAGVFQNCLKTREGSALKPREEEYKTYAPGVGLIQDADLRLTRHGFIEKHEK